MAITSPEDVARPGGPGLTVGVLCLLLHLSILRVLTAERAQLAGISSGAQGYLLSKCLWTEVASRPSSPHGVKAWWAQHRQSPASMEQVLSPEGLPKEIRFLS